jgi:uncharacterized membrane protein YphA (DoxX/SURF4 family)
MVMRITGRQGLALVRMSLGALFMVSAVDKTSKQWLAGNPKPVTDFVQQNASKAESIYRPFLEGTVVPHAPLIAQLVTLGEWVAGVSLLFGLLTRLGALMSMWLLVNYMLAKGTLVHGLENSLTYSDRVYFMAALAALLGAAGLAWGLDGALRGTLARLPGVRWLAGLEERPISAGSLAGWRPASTVHPLRPAEQGSRRDAVERRRAA